MKKKQEGHILIVVLIVFAVVLIMGTGLLGITSATHKNAIVHTNKNQASIVAKSTLEIILKHFKDYTVDANMLLPLNVGDIVRGTEFNVKDAHNHDWKTRVDIINIGSDEFEVRAYVNGTGTNSNVHDEMAVIVKGEQLTNVLGGAYTQAIDIDGSTIRLINGTIFSNGTVSIKNSNASIPIDLDRLVGMGGIVMRDNLNKINIDKVYAENDITLINNLFQSGSLLKEVSLKAGVGTASETGGNSVFPPAVTIEANRPGWVDSIRNNPPVAPVSPIIYSDNVVFEPLLAGGFPGAIAEPIMPQYLTKTDAINNTMEIQINAVGKTVMLNDNLGSISGGGYIGVDIYNPDGIVHFKNTGSNGGIAHPITLVGQIVAKEIIFQNCHEITLDLDSGAGGGSVVYIDFDVIRYEE